MSVQNSVWEVATPGGWVSLTGAEHDQAELAFASNPSQHVIISWNGQSAKLDFSRLCLDCNGTILKVRRRDRNASSASASLERDAEPVEDEKDDEEEEEKDDQSLKKVMTRIELVCNESCTNPQAPLDVFLSSLQKSTNINFDRPLGESELQHLETLAKRFNISLTNASTDGSYAVCLTGPKKLFELAQMAIKDHLDKIGAIDRKEYPSSWLKQSENCQLVPVVQGSDEWNQIIQRMLTTIPNVKLESVVRIQNKWLWLKYTDSKALLEKKNNGRANEMTLYHGTRNLKPETIYRDDQEGFDLRYCTSGMWGIATYFAFNASYSNSYAHCLPNGHKQMFLARVLLGDCIDLPPNSSLRKPPSKGTKNAMGYVEDYDSVSGETGRSKVYMIYELRRAYPEYLITYTD